MVQPGINLRLQLDVLGHDFLGNGFQRLKVCSRVAIPEFVIADDLNSAFEKLGKFLKLVLGRHVANVA